jgi:hypothetical protein
VHIKAQWENPWGGGRGRGWRGKRQAQIVHLATCEEVLAFLIESCTQNRAIMRFYGVHNVFGNVSGHRSVECVVSTENDLPLSPRLRRQ